MHFLMFWIIITSVVGVLCKRDMGISSAELEQSAFNELNLSFTSSELAELAELYSVCVYTHASDDAR